ncbi:MAG: hypothetical protein V4496_05470, partial [Pseudomonadota bacterium]
LKAIRFFSSFSDIDFEYLSEENALERYCKAVQENILLCSESIMRPFHAIQLLNDSINRFSKELRGFTDSQEINQIFSSKEFYRLLSEAVIREDVVVMTRRAKNKSLNKLVEVIINLQLFHVNPDLVLQAENNNFKKRLIADIKKIPKFGAKKSFILLLESDFPTHFSLRFIGAIAEGKCGRTIFREKTKGRDLYHKFQCFSGIRSESNVQAIFAKYRNNTQEALAYESRQVFYSSEPCNFLCTKEKLSELAESLETLPDCRYSTQGKDTFFGTFLLPKIVKDWVSEVKASSSGYSLRQLSLKAEEFLQYSESTDYDRAVRMAAQRIQAFIDDHLQLSELARAKQVKAQTLVLSGSK